MYPSTFFLLPLLLASYVSAHGFLHQVGIAGKTFTGSTPSGQKIASIIRPVRTQDPIKGANNPDVNCGTNATPASDVADANPGDVLTFDWKTASLGSWPHNVGPILTYLASCGSTTCDKFDSQNAKWFKIDQAGRKANGGDWVQADLMNGGKASTKLPANLAPGNYLVRHEIIALHLAPQRGGAEFYAACAQIRVGGSGTGKPAADELVSLPGAYSDSDPGIFVPDVFNSGLKYQFPGPAVARFVSGGASGEGSGNIPTGTTAAPGKATKTASSSPAKTKVCRLKKSASASAKPAAATASTEIYPRHFSRVMRRIVDSSRFQRRSA